jgi:hypothetical protein
MPARPLTNGREYSFGTVKLDGRFKIGSRSYSVRSGRSGYVVQSRQERLSLAYSRAGCKIELTDRRVRTAIEVDVRKAPELRVVVASGGETRRLRGTVEEVANGLLTTDLEYPRAPAMRVLLAQVSLNAEFEHEYARVVSAAVPLGVYGPFLAAAMGLCKAFCAICAAQLILTPGPTPDDIPACVTCLACRALNGA